MKSTGILVLAAVLPLLAAPALAQLGEATPEEAKIGRPSPFTPITDTTPPPSDPRDFAGMWRMRMGGPGGPGGARPGGGRGGPGGGGPGGGGPGGPPGAAARGGPGGGGPPGGAGGGRASSRYCIPGTMLLSSVEGGTEILQRPDELRIVTEEQHNNRRIYINQQHTSPLVRSVNGDSIAHWDGNTLVIDTIGFIGYGVSPTLERTERLSKSADGRTLSDAVTYRDSSGRPTPAAMTSQMTWAPGTRVLEYICEDGSVEYMRKDYQ